MSYEPLVTFYTTSAVGVQQVYLGKLDCFEYDTISSKAFVNVINFLIYLFLTSTSL